jgi:hypothetical protein
MGVDPLAERLARVRQRFASGLEGMIEITYASIPNLSGTSSAVIDAVGEAYRRMHGIVGIGSMVGFAVTGRAARSVENILLLPHQTERGLTIEEIFLFENALRVLREAAASELQSLYPDRR